MAVRQVASRIVVDVQKANLFVQKCAGVKTENTKNDNYESDDLSGTDVDDD